MPRIRGVVDFVQAVMKKRQKARLAAVVPRGVRDLSVMGANLVQECLEMLLGDDLGFFANLPAADNKA
eukprot:6718973-Lingulodinium_polyedra.AAC.1